jgi:hypothetical protein
LLNIQHDAFCLANIYKHFVNFCFIYLVYSSYEHHHRNNEPQSITAQQNDLACFDRCDSLGTILLFQLYQIRKMKKILCFFGWHKWVASLQDYIDEFGAVPENGRISSKAKCSRCNKNYK